MAKNFCILSSHESVDMNELCAIQIYRDGGIRGFYPGYAPSLMRSFPANAACFLAYEWCHDLLS